MSGIITNNLTPRAEMLLSRLPENIREAVELLAEVIGRKAPERLDKAKENALISVVSKAQEIQDENGL